MGTDPSGRLVNRSEGVAMPRLWWGRSVLYSWIQASRVFWARAREGKIWPPRNSWRKVRWNLSTLPVVVGDAGAVRRWVMPFSRQILSKSTSVGLRPNRLVKTLPLSVRISSGTPWRSRPEPESHTPAGPWPSP